MALCVLTGSIFTFSDDHDCLDVTGCHPSHIKKIYIFWLKSLTCNWKKFQSTGAWNKNNNLPPRPLLHNRTHLCTSYTICNKLKHQHYLTNWPYFWVSTPSHSHHHVIYAKRPSIAWNNLYCSIMQYSWGTSFASSTNNIAWPSLNLLWRQTTVM